MFRKSRASSANLWCLVCEDGGGARGDCGRRVASNVASGVSGEDAVSPVGRLLRSGRMAADIVSLGARPKEFELREAAKLRKKDVQLREDTELRQRGRGAS